MGHQGLKGLCRTSLTSVLSGRTDSRTFTEMQNIGRGWGGGHSSGHTAAPVLFKMAVLSLSLDRIPQILNVATELEFNLGTMPRINCAAAGDPFPVRGSMKLRKPDGTMLQVSPGHPNLLSAPPSHQPDSSFLGSLTHGTFYRLCPLP